MIRPEPTYHYQWGFVVAIAAFVVVAINSNFHESEYSSLYGDWDEFKWNEMNLQDKVRLNYSKCFILLLIKWLSG